MAHPLSLLDGFQLPLEGGRLLLREKRLWALAAAPIGFSVLAFTVGASLLVTHAGDLYAWATPWMPARVDSAHIEPHTGARSPPVIAAPRWRSETYWSPPGRSTST